jgi:acyl-CoA synthetase (AMP-forming)/AMP-acid ligase II
LEISRYSVEEAGLLISSTLEKTGHLYFAPTCRKRSFFSLSTDFVIPKDGADLKPDDLIAWSKAELSNYKYPRIVRVVDELPLGATGKVLKTELRKQIGD